MKALFVKRGCCCIYLKDTLLESRDYCMFLRLVASILYYLRLILANLKFSSTVKVQINIFRPRVRLRNFQPMTYKTIPAKVTIIKLHFHKTLYYSWGVEWCKKLSLFIPLTKNKHSRCIHLRSAYPVSLCTAGLTRNPGRNFSERVFT